MTSKLFSLNLLFFSLILIFVLVCTFINCTLVFSRCMQVAHSEARRPLDISLTSATLDTPPVSPITPAVTNINFRCRWRCLPPLLTPLSLSPPISLALSVRAHPNFAYDYTKFASHYFMSGRSWTCTWSSRASCTRGTAYKWRLQYW